jgi:hypothetical protein
MKAAKLKRMYRARVLTPHLDPEIVPVDCTAVTGTHVTYFSANGKETRDALVSDNVGYFESTVDAKAFIRRFIKQKQGDFQAMADAWGECYVRFETMGK